MKRFAIPIATFSLVLASYDFCLAQTAVEPPVVAPDVNAVTANENTEAILQESIRGYYAALTKKDKPKALAYVHPQSSGLPIIIATMDNIFPIATFTYDITEPKLLSIDNGLAFVRYKQTANLVATTVEFEDERKELDMLDVFKQDNGVWKRWSTAILASTPKPTGKKIIPTPKPIPGQKIFVDPAAKVILERAAKLYGSKPKWSGEIVLNGAITEGTIKIAFERPKKLRFDINEIFERRLIITDGKNVSDWAKSDESAPEVDVSPLDQSLDSILLELGSTGETGNGIVPVLVHLLNGKSGLTGDEWRLKIGNAKSLSIKRLPDAVYNGLKVQCVVFDTRFAEVKYYDHKREQWWFTPEGKLVRVMGRQDLNNKIDGTMDTWDDKITQQNLNPTFGPNTFALSKPPVKTPAKPKKK